MYHRRRMRTIFCERTTGHLPSPKAMLRKPAQKGKILPPALSAIITADSNPSGLSDQSHGIDVIPVHQSPRIVIRVAYQIGFGAKPLDDRIGYCSSGVGCGARTRGGTVREQPVIGSSGNTYRVCAASTHALRIAARPAPMGLTNRRTRLKRAAFASSQRSATASDSSVDRSSTTIRTSAANVCARTESSASST
jgi:hypothetical protein